MRDHAERCTSLAPRPSHPICKLMLIVASSACAGLSVVTILSLLAAPIKWRRLKKLSDCCVQFLLRLGGQQDANVTNIVLANEAFKLRVSNEAFSGHIRRHMHRRFPLMAYFTKHITSAAPDNVRPHWRGASDASKVN